jgi:phospholipid transport system transporter-binding protein
MAEISQQANQWLISGDLLMDNACKILDQSTGLEMVDHLEVDFSAVTDVDTSALSLMMEWQRRAAKTSHQIRFTHVPVNLTSLADLYGVKEFIHY